MAERTSSFLAGLIGAGIGASLSPPLHEREGEENGLRIVYRLIDIDDIKLDVSRTATLLTEALHMGYSGLNITHPCKQVVFDHLDELSPEAATIGAVNTVVFNGTWSVGHNTDWIGFSRALDRGVPGGRVRDVVLVGAGGAGSAVAYALLRRGVHHLTVVDVARTPAEALVSRMADHFGGSRVSIAHPDELESRLARADGVINATPIGMLAHPGLPFPSQLLTARHWVADLIYAPFETELLHHARGIGCRALGGGGMLVFQAAEAFRLFTGTQPDAERMLRHYRTLTAPESTPMAS
ncbi:shikimate dehydrogenase (NADP(+)) [Planotetraspora thailandica]|uniref:Shikimate dehydrogenase (NADP(+)) n=1 Tax=Planotetraspora thailandica TaxID=487172 RepID=A0A8J3VC06_9ACTN|nr:shikimate dehydrogenase [Planotetraspora thailandica]GII54375.1 shikimate dehydrogenase (NADP(+)) [Planotetraspora thailandica]